ncbi:hypothetical protein D0Z08_10290 [Nocardioides immobilis]|uniref:Uncharacterized protein n=1 Tax=Nocardioides immobilis TaxID=2049295 RepID=A0A417Y396_9ACTN|nr:hypothetical protein [Nocardioides immobilis]RHW27056.1 hypothetical protein D0Z08_10290 [Nocardioides immobilis]
MPDPLYRQRYRALKLVIEEMDRRRDGVIPSQVAELWEVFEDDVDLVGALQMRWYTRLSGRIDFEQSRGHDRDQAVVSAWRLTHAEMPGVRMALDRLLESPTCPQMGLMLAKAQRNEHIMVALWPVLPGFTTTAPQRSAPTSSAPPATSRTSQTFNASIQ